MSSREYLAARVFLPYASLDRHPFLEDESSGVSILDPMDSDNKSISAQVAHASTFPAFRGIAIGKKTRDKLQLRSNEFKETSSNNSSPIIEQVQTLRAYKSRSDNTNQP